MKNNNKVTILLLIGALVAGAGGWFLTQDYIDTEVSQYQRKHDQERQAISVVVAARDLNVGDVVSTQSAQIRQIPAAYLHRDSVRPNFFASKLEGRPLIHPIRAGEPILPIHVTSVKIEGLSSLLEEGQRAITIPVDSLNTISGFLNPGDNIDLYITLRDGDRDRTVPLVENVRVLATGKDIDDGIKEKNMKGYRELTLGVSPLNATKIIHAQTVGDIAVLLRKRDDDRSGFDDYVTIDNLVDIPQESAPQPQRPASWGFELIKGGTRS